MGEMIGPLSVIGLILLGIGLLWAVRLAYGGRSETSDDAMRLILTIAGWLLIQVGVVSVVAQIFYVAPSSGLAIPVLLGGIVALGIVMSIFGMAVARYRALEWRSLMWTLSAAAEKGVPLDQAARGFALERTDEIGLRVTRLADLLAGGTPLPEALTGAHSRLPIDGVLAARFGTEAGDLGGAIAAIAQRDAELEALLRVIVEKLMYFVVVVSSLALIGTFVMLRIVPVFAKMFEEFETPLPWLTMRVIEVSELVVRYGIVVLPLFALVFVTALILGVLYYVGWLPWDVPGLGWAIRRYDGALVMRALGYSVRRRQSIGAALHVLSRVYPKRSIRGRLTRAGERVDRGSDWCDALVAEGLIRSPEAAVLRAAERAGNLDWALDEMADSTVRRGAYRLRVWLNVLFPTAVVLLGGGVAFLVVGLFWPLVELIQAVAPQGGLG